MEHHPLLRRKVVVTLENGFHLRPASLVAQVTGGFSGDVSIRRNDGYSVNAKSMFDLMTLQADLGTELMLEAQGEGAEDLLNHLENLFETNFGADDEEEDFAEKSQPPATHVKTSRPQPVEPE